MLRLLLTSSLVLLISACTKSEGGAIVEKQVDKNNVKETQEEVVEDAVPDFETAVEVQGQYNKDGNTLTAHVMLKDGFHAYAPGTELGVPVSLSISNENGWVKTGEITIPKGEVKDLAVGVSNVIEGDFDMSAVIEGGTGPVMAEAKIQVCTEKVCDRPRTYAFNVSTEAAEAEPAANDTKPVAQ